MCASTFLGKATNLYDFTGINTFTTNYHNYNDPFHFSDRVAAKMMEIIYDSDSTHQQQMLDSIYTLPEKIDILD